MAMDKESEFDDMPPISHSQIHIDIKKDEPMCITIANDVVPDTILKHHHNRRMIISNGISVLLASSITAAVTLTVYFTNCNKD